MAKTVRVTPEEFARRWGTGLSGAIETMREGIKRVTVAPGKSAAAKADKWHTAISRQDTKAKWASRVGAITLEDWQASMIDKGLTRISSGVEQAQGKMAAFGEKLISHQNRLLAEQEGMADITLEDSIARMIAWTRGMSKFSV